ncbi:MAG: NAD(P)-dependent alcohol dehydrogenase [Dehalococcoidales bacterium]|nr:NAD(P)-dependent alcohol dehydrogenase [Dehalococcoidales bacterium]
MKALVLRQVKQLELADWNIVETPGPEDVRIKIHTVGICGSDVHFYQHGKIGNFIVKQPMVLGHEASGTVMETGSNVKHLKAGDRVCMEPGIPDLHSRATMEGCYNLDPSVRFWATPPVHGCLRETVVHPGIFVFKLPENLGYAEGAMAEPLSVGLQAVKKANVRPGDIALVTGCGTIGLVTGLAALAGGCSKVIITDTVQPKLDIAAGYGMIPVNIEKQDLREEAFSVTGGWGADIIFEASGNESAISGIFEYLCPGGRVVFIGMPVEPVPVDIVAAQAKEARIETVFRYANIYPRALSLMESGKIDVKPLITDKYTFAESIRAFDYAVNPGPNTVKIIIELQQ